MLDRNIILSQEQNFCSANFGKSFGKSTSSNAAKVINTLYNQARSQERFKVGEVSRNMESLINVSCTAYNRKTPLGKEWCFFSKIL